MLQILLWGILGGLVGFLVFLVAPMAAQIRGIDEQVRVGNWYFTLSMKAYRRVMCLVTPHNDINLYPGEWDDDAQAEKVENGSNPDKFQDPKGSVARCKTVPFTMAFTDKASIIHPLDAHVGAALEKIEQQGRKFAKFASGEKSFVAHSAHVNITTGYRGVDLQSARKALNESHQPSDAHRTEKDVQKSQSGYNSKDLLEMTIILLACGGGALTAWVIYSNTGDTDSAVRLPMTAMGWAL